jgi:hypothetical protein
MADIFVSYAAEDRDRARTLAHALEERGWMVWWDRQIPLGRTYDDVIEQALAAARCAIVLWSRHSIASEWVRSEASEAKRRGILVPVLVEAVEPPLAFRLIHGADLTAWQPGSRSDELEQLAQRVRELVAQERLTSSATASERSDEAARQVVIARQGGRHWWWAAAAAVTASVVLVAVLLTGGVRRTGGDSRGDAEKKPAPTGSEPAPVGTTQSGSTAESSAESGLDDLFQAIGDQSAVGGLHVFEVKELALKLAWVSPQNAASLSAVGYPAASGAMVLEVDDGPALQAGLRKGDLITAVGPSTIKSVQDLRVALRAVGPGTTRYQIRRNGKASTIDIACKDCTVP